MDWIKKDRVLRAKTLVDHLKSAHKGLGVDIIFLVNHLPNQQVLPLEGKMDDTYNKRPNGSTSGLKVWRDKIHKGILSYVDFFPISAYLG